MRCKVCAEDAKFLFRKVLFHKYDVAYFRCESCELVCTEEPYWLKEAYEESIAGIRDTFMVARNLAMADFLSRLICRYFDVRGRFIDYGAGTGLLVRLMRDRGFDFTCHEPFARNIFARGFECPPKVEGQSEFELLTAIEMFEHSPDPLGDVKRMLEYSDSILFTTELQPRRVEAIAEWQYLYPDAGTHVSFYTRRTLEVLANATGLRLASDGVSLHFMSRGRRHVPPQDLRLDDIRFSARLARWAIGRLSSVSGNSLRNGSLTMSDHEFIAKKS